MKTKKERRDGGNGNEKEMEGREERERGKVGEGKDDSWSLGGSTPVSEMTYYVSSGMLSLPSRSRLSPATLSGCLVVHR